MCHGGLVKRTIVVCLALGVAVAPPIDGQSQGASIELRLECILSGLAQVDTFRFTLSNNGAEHMSVVVGKKYSGGSWTPTLRLAVKGKTSRCAPVD